MELPRPEVVRCFFERSFEPPLPAMVLAWQPDGAEALERTWYLPDNVQLNGPAPERFGISIHRRGLDSYRVRVLWNGLSLSWDDLTRVEVMTGSFPLILNALGTDLWYLLNQPPEIPPSDALPRAA